MTSPALKGGAFSFAPIPDGSSNRHRAGIRGEDHYGPGDTVQMLDG